MLFSTAVGITFDQAIAYEAHEDATPLIMFNREDAGAKDVRGRLDDWLRFRYPQYHTKTVDIGEVQGAITAHGRAILAVWPTYGAWYRQEPFVYCLLVTYVRSK